jgi:hypothetical protein
MRIFPVQFKAVIFCLLIAVNTNRSVDRWVRTTISLTKAIIRRTPEGGKNAVVSTGQY